MNKRKIGSKYEEQAKQYLEHKGYKILEQNFRCRQGEIDLIAKDGRSIVFVEVKYRMGSGSGDAAEAVDYKKRKIISRVALFYLTKMHLGEETPCRFDVVVIRNGQLEHYENAFDYCV